MLTSEHRSKRLSSDAMTTPPSAWSAATATRLAAAFAPNHFAAKWYLLRPGDDGTAARQADAAPLPARSLAGVVSAACEAVYPHTPEIRNEMLGRHQLTSQGAKARRELMA